jgi:ketosteroid isomerase-like protein
MVERPASSIAWEINHAWRAKDLARLDILLADDVELTSYLTGGRAVTGKAMVLDAVRRAAETMYELTISTIEDLTPVLALGTGSVRYEGADRVLVTTPAAWVWTFSEGRLTSGRTFRTRADALAHVDELQAHDRRLR